MVITKRKPDFKKNLYEKEAWARSEFVCGIDEVGRSCFAGPVVAAAVILPLNTGLRMIQDSKLMTAQEREKAYAWLEKHSRYAVGIIHHRMIDSKNIYQATLVAMKRALVQLLETSTQAPSVILVDAMPVKLDHIDIPVVHFPYGERQSKSIAAASIVAKVTRDRLMARLDPVLPGYDYSNNKGYGTKVHRDAIKTEGLNLIHRMSFLTNQLEDTPLPLIFPETPQQELSE